MVQQHYVTYKKNSAIVRIPKEAKPQNKAHDRNLLVKAVVRECCGMSPYERRILELLRLNKDRAALRFANKRIGKFALAKKKISEISQFK